MGRTLMDWISKGFTGKIIFTLDLNKGGISRAVVNVQHDLSSV
jgi:hypothetical protein